jgi:outer membrane receptor for ferrienterochelin and colicins
MSVQNTKRKSYYGAGKNLNAYGNTNNNTAVGGIQYVYQFDKLFFMPSEFISGVEYQYDDIDDSMPGYNRSLQQTTQTTGLFLQNEWKNSQLNILIGARLDKHNLLKNAVISPRMNLKYNFSKNLNWRGSYAAGFRAPQAFDEDLHLDAVGGTVKMIQIAANLRPEYSHTFSSSLDYYLKLGTVETNFLIEGFSTRINDVFILVDQGLNPNGQIIMERQNGSGARVSGINLEGKIAPSSKILAQFGFTLQKSLYDEAERWSDDLTIAAERKMLRTPSNYGYFTLAYNISKKFTLDATGTYTGSMLAPHLAGYIAKDKLEITPSFVDLNLKGSYNLKLNGIALQISGGVKNILNSYQKDLDSGPNRDGSYVYGPQIPRSFFVGVKFGN